MAKVAMTERSVRFSAKQWELVQKYADMHELSLSDVLRMIVDKFFGVKEGEA